MEQNTADQIQNNESNNSNDSNNKELDNKTDVNAHQHLAGDKNEDMEINTNKTCRLTESEIKFFNTVLNFVDDIDVYLSGIKQSIPAVSRYNELLRHTRLVNKKNIRKHIEAFTHFITVNNDLIFLLPATASAGFKFKQAVIKFSDNVFIDMNAVLKRCDADSIKVIMEHLLTLKYLVNPSEDVKNALISMQFAESSRKNGTQEQVDTANQLGAALGGGALDGIFDIIGKNIDKDEPNPMNSIMKLIASPAFGEIVAEVQHTAQNGGLNGIMAALGGALGGAGGGGAAAGGLDLGAIMGAMGAMGGNKPN